MNMEFVKSVLESEGLSMLVLAYLNLKLLGLVRAMVNKNSDGKKDLDEIIKKNN